MIIPLFLPGEAGSVSEEFILTSRFAFGLQVPYHLADPDMTVRVSQSVSCSTRVLQSSFFGDDETTQPP